MSKLLIIGDIHAKTIWKDIIVKEKEFDKCIFLGDEFDDYEMTGVAEQLHNFKSILQLKIDNPEKYILLIANHLHHYRPRIMESYSGYRQATYYNCSEIIEKAIQDDLMQICHLEDNLLFSHAGFSKFWCNTFGFNYFDEDYSEMFKRVNMQGKTMPQIFNFKQGKNRCNYGDDITQGPLWIRPKSLADDAIPKVHQIVGHTEQLRPLIENLGDRNLVFCDCLKYRKYLVIQDGEFIPKTLE